MKFHFQFARYACIAGILATALTAGIATAQSRLYEDTPLNQRVLKSTVNQYIAGNCSVTDLRLNLQKNSHGIHGHMSIYGDLTPAGINIPADATARQRSNMLVRKFLAREAVNLLDIAQLSELSIRKTHVDSTGWIMVLLDRYIGGLKIEGATVTFNINPDGRIGSFSATLVAVPPELRRVVTQTTLDEKQIRELIEQDLKKPVRLEYQTAGRNINNMHKVARVSAPYVVWRVKTSVWDYWVDAFSGEILTRLPQVIIN